MCEVEYSQRPREVHVAVTTETELHDTEGAGPPAEDTEEDRSPGRGAYTSES